jgi:hypothetical protein
MRTSPVQNEHWLARLQALALVVLTLARIRIDTLAEAAVLPLRQADVARHPWLGRLLPADTMRLLAQQQLTDPVGLLLIVAALGCLLAFLLVVEFAPAGRLGYRLRLALLAAIIVLTVFAPSVKLMLLRQGSGPASYSHDGGVIQTEATIAFFLAGRNPYAEDYTQTPLAEWGFGEFRTALSHYPYLPWTFLFSAPFRLAAEGLWGWYDQRLVYLLLFALTLLCVSALAGGGSRLLLLMIVGLNPIMGSDLIYGQNDSFVLAWLVFGVWLWRQGQITGKPGWTAAAAAVYGLACASKPTAWFFAPFFVLLLAGGEAPDLWRRPLAWLGRAVRTSWPALATAGLCIGPYVVWNAPALWDDVWAWANGTSATSYQIWGWGASNLLLALGQVESRFSYWPFWRLQLLLAAPVLAALLWHQVRDNRLGRALWGYGLFLLIFFFVSRFLNENYLGYITALLACGALSEAEPV